MVAIDASVKLPCWIARPPFGPGLKASGPCYAQRSRRWPRFLTPSRRSEEVDPDFVEFGWRSSASSVPWGTLGVLTPSK